MRALISEESEFRNSHFEIRNSWLRLTSFVAKKSSWRLARVRDDYRARQTPTHLGSFCDHLLKRIRFECWVLEGQLLGCNASDRNCRIRSNPVRFYDQGNCAR